MYRPHVQSAHTRELVSLVIFSLSSAVDKVFAVLLSNLPYSAFIFFIVSSSRRKSIFTPDTLYAETIHLGVRRFGTHNFAARRIIGNRRMRIIEVFSYAVSCTFMVTFAENCNSSRQFSGRVLPTD